MALIGSASLAIVTGAASFFLGAIPPQGLMSECFWLGMAVAAVVVITGAEGLIDA